MSWVASSAWLGVMRKHRPITAVLVKTDVSAEALDSYVVEGKQGRKLWAGS
jgi:hypothetical protein